MDTSTNRKLDEIIKLLVAEHKLLRAILHELENNKNA